LCIVDKHGPHCKTFGKQKKSPSQCGDAGRAPAPNGAFQTPGKLELVVRQVFRVGGLDVKGFSDGILKVFEVAREDAAKRPRSSRRAQAFDGIPAQIWAAVKLSKECCTVKKRNTHLRVCIGMAAIFVLAIPLVAVQAFAGPKGGGGGGGVVRGGGGLARGGGGGGRSFSVSRAGAGIGARSFSGSRFSGRSSSRSAVRSANVRLHTAGAGPHFAGASPRTFATAGALSRPAGLARAHAAFGNRVIANAAFKSSFARPPIFFGRFHGSHWPWWTGGIVIGWIGPVFWPYAYYDFFDYVFWPYAYDGFWPYAYEDVYYGIYGDYAYVDPAVRAGRSRTARTARAAPASEQRAVGVCSENAPELTNWPIERISQVVEPNEAQRAALDELKSATAKSIDILKAACPNDLPSIPTGRMAAMESRLQVMLQAVQTVRPPLDGFFKLLSDEQKARFNAIAPADASGARKDQRDLTRLCSERGPGIADLPIDRIAQAVSPTETQQPALEELRAASAKAAEALKNNCPTAQALTPAGRVEAMEQRLTTMLEAVKTVQPALTKFYDSLTFEQRARFNTLGSTRPGA
jgi:hypothetical protein